MTPRRAAPKGWRRQSCESQREAIAALLAEAASEVLENLPLSGYVTAQRAVRLLERYFQDNGTLGRRPWGKPPVENE